jgi:hypothetical protein
MDYVCLKRKFRVWPWGIGDIVHPMPVGVNGGDVRDDGMIAKSVFNVRYGTAERIERIMHAVSCAGGSSDANGTKFRENIRLPLGGSLRRSISAGIKGRPDLSRISRNDAIIPSRPFWVGAGSLGGRGDVGWWPRHLQLEPFELLPRRRLIGTKWRGDAGSPQG